MSSHSIWLMVLTVVFSMVITELFLLLCWRTFGDRGAYPWYSCLLRTAVYSPCILVGAQGFTLLPLSSALVLSWRGTGGEIVWLYGFPEIFVGITCVLVSFGIRLINTPAQ